MTGFIFDTAEDLKYFLIGFFNWKQTKNAGIQRIKLHNDKQIEFFIIASCENEFNERIKLIELYMDNKIENKIIYTCILSMDTSKDPVPQLDLFVKLTPLMS